MTDDRTIAAMVDMLPEVLDDAALDARSLAHEMLLRELDEHRIGEWVSEPVFREERTEMLKPVYADDVDFDANPEPIGWELVPMIRVYASRRCAELPTANG